MLRFRRGRERLTSHAARRKSNFDLCHVRAGSAQGIEYGNGDSRPARVDLGRYAVPAVRNRVVCKMLREVVTALHVLIHMVRHHARGEVVGLIEQHRLPGALEEVGVSGITQPTCQCIQLLCGQQAGFDLPCALLEFDTTAVGALEDRVEIVGENGQVGAARGDGCELRGHGISDSERGVGLLVELRDQRWHIAFRLRHIHSGQTEFFGSMDMLV